MMDWMWGAGALWWIVGMIFMIGFWAAVIAGIVLLVRWLVRSRPAERPEGASSLEILKQRYAKGEISKEEYLDKKKDLI